MNSKRSEIQSLYFNTNIYTAAYSNDLGPILSLYAKYLRNVGYKNGFKSLGQVVHLFKAALKFMQKTIKQIFKGYTYRNAFFGSPAKEE